MINRVAELKSKIFCVVGWNKPNQLFTDTKVKNPKLGINLDSQYIKGFVGKYLFEKMIQNI